MSLRLWMPLMGDLRNQGLDNFDITTLGTISWVDGKLGAKALQAGNANQTINGVSINSNLTDILADEYSVSVWVKPLGNHVHYNGTILSSGDWNHTRWSFGVNQDNTKVDVLSNRHNVYLNCTVPVNEWTHLVCTCDSSNRAHLYKNGEYIGYTTLSDKPLSDAINATIGRETYASGYFSFNGVIQDLRLYDHCLSEMEVKQLSQGLILHYPLNRQGFGQENLLKNTNDLTKWNKESGISVEWNETESMYKVFTTTRESSRWGIYQDCAVTVDTDTDYTFSLTGKTDGFTAYLSFGAGSSWPSNYIAFTTTKQRLSKTLTIPAGTTNIRVYLAMYPKTGGGHVYFEKPKLEKGSIVTPWAPNSADELYTTMGLNSNIEYDTSGYCNNGEYYAYDTNGSISYNSDTPKYTVSTHIASANPTQSAASGTRYLYGHCALTNPTQMSVAFWLKPITGGYGSTTSNGQGYFCTTNYEYGNASVGSDYQASAMNHRDGAVNMNDSASTTQCNVTFYPTIGEWHHYVYTYDGQVGRGYKDGIQTATAQFSAAKTLDSFIGVVIGFSKAGGVWRRNDACYSDFRIYATALSADDVKSLYQNCAYIDSSGNVYGAVHLEV